MTDSELWGVLGSHPGWDRDRIDRAKMVVESYDPPPSYAVPSRESVAAYLCRLLFLLEACGQRQDHEAWVEVDALRAALASGLAICKCSVRILRYVEGHFLRALQYARANGLVRDREEDRHRPGMASGSGWVDLVSLTPAGYRLAFPDDSSMQRVPSPQNTAKPPEDGSASVEKTPAQDEGNPTPPPTTDPDVPPDTVGKREAAHSIDFRSVNWFGSPYIFTATQAACIKVLWEAWKNGTPILAEATILEDERVESNGNRLRDVFNKGKHNAWSAMIQPGPTKGTFRLVTPEQKT